MYNMDLAVKDFCIGSAAPSATAKHITSLSQLHGEDTAVGGDGKNEQCESLALSQYNRLST